MSSFTVVGAGASAAIVAIHVIDDCQLIQAHQADFPITFAVGGTVGNLAGLQCFDSDNNGVVNGFIAWTGQADFANPGAWQLYGTVYGLRGTELTELDYLERSATTTEADFVYGQLTCGLLIL